MRENPNLAHFQERSILLMMMNLIQRLVLILVIVKGQSFDNDTFHNEKATAASRRTNQVTTILDRLLKNYDAQIRPNFGGKNNLSPRLFSALSHFE